VVIIAGKYLIAFQSFMIVLLDNSEIKSNPNLTNFRHGRRDWFHENAFPGVNFINVKRTNVVSAAFSSYMYVVKAAKTYISTKNSYV